MPSLHVVPLDEGAHHSKRYLSKLFYFIERYKLRNDVGSVSNTFRGSGTATLTFGDCFQHTGQIKVSLNGEVIAKSTRPNQQEIVEFQYGPGDVLKISEGFGIIQIFSLHLDCEGTFEIICK